MKKRTGIVFAVILPAAVVMVSIVLYLYVLDSGARAEAQEEKNASRDMVNELRKEQQLLVNERERLEEYERNLNSFAGELEQKYNDYLLREKALKTKEEAFNKKLAQKTVDRQVIETYENIDPEQAAVLIKNLYSKDHQSAILIMRKISGKKAGRILEAMILIDKDVSTQLAQAALDYFKPE
jgi:flagellar motility protein MotE (MotC chaperone)